MLMVGYASVQQSKNSSNINEGSKSSGTMTDSALVQQSGHQMLSVIPLNRINIP